MLPMVCQTPKVLNADPMSIQLFLPSGQRDLSGNGAVGTNLDGICNVKLLKFLQSINTISHDTKAELKIESYSTNIPHYQRTVQSTS